jgi:hypothetical protein
VGVLEPAVRQKEQALPAAELVEPVEQRVPEVLEASDPVPPAAAEDCNIQVVRNLDTKFGYLIACYDVGELYKIARGIFVNYELYKSLSVIG